MSLAPDTDTFAKPEALLRVPVGLSSPLWGLFAGAALSGATWWWMTRWARPENLEALFGAAAETEPPVAPEAATFAAPEPVLEAAAEAAPEPVAVEAAPEPASVLGALMEPAPEVVGGESAPVSPVLEAIAPEAAEPTKAAAGPKPRKMTPKTA